MTGALHMGHALNGTIQDVLMRLNRMRGRNTLWALGTDHAGIATQAVVESELREEGKSRGRSIGREAFVERVWEWRERYGSQIVEQYKRLGASCDYERERFTLDEAYVRAVYRVFVALYDKGLIYRDNYMVNWDPGLALGDLRPRGGEPRGRGHALLRSTIRSRAPSASSRSPPFARRRCSPTPRSRSIRTTTATATWSASTASCRWSAGACR